ncbi:MAG: acetylxylan esterase [Planctomycetota bacterium]|nr:MAG: acetylxylan esterase [Planctomycetota bacterium]
MRMPHIVLLAIALLPLATASAHAEIQTLFRGECFTEAAGARKLGDFAAQYDTPEEWHDRAERIRHGVLRGMNLQQLPPPGELKPIRHTVRNEDGYTVENVAFESLPGFWVTGNLYLPEKAEQPAAGVLCPHGHLDDNRMLEQTQKRCAALARMGAIVLAWDMIGYGESRPVPHRHSEAVRLQTYNSMRCVDFLLSLGAVDETRLAVTGESGGGTQSFLLAAVDPRIDVSAPVVMVSAHFYGGCMCESGMPIHKSAEHETNNVEIAASIAPRPQLLVSCGGDWTRQTPTVEFPYLQRVYGLMGAAGNVENAHFADEQHDYGPSKRAAVYRFLAKHLKLDLGRIQNDKGEIDESFVTVHDRDALLVFPPDKPRPDYAETDGEKIVRMLDRRG